MKEQMFSTEALEAGIEKCKQNIQIFEDAIDKERETIKHYYELIGKLQEKKRIHDEAAQNIHIEVEVENDGG